MSLLHNQKRAAMNMATGVMSYYICRQDGGLVPHVDSQGGGGGGPDLPMRPKLLEVGPAATFAAKGVREDGGSLPCTPEQHSDSEAEAPGCPAAGQLLAADTNQVVAQTMKHFAGRSGPRCEHRALPTTKRVVEGVLEKHRYAYNGMIKKLSLEESGDDVTFVGEVATNLFADGTTNWGRIASLLAFGAAVCQHLKGLGRESCVESVGQEISRYLLSEQGDWLLENNSWDGFVEFFRIADPESTVRNTLMAFAGLAGISATLALLIR